ncbi:MAG TPA: hypothetical protein VFF89_01680 [Sphingobium sp.]|nr:hypothetical protein [Sphingobium sp.]
MPSKNRIIDLDRASRSLSGFVFAGCIGGLLFGVAFGGIASGVAGGLLLAPLLWLGYVGVVARP